MRHRQKETTATKKTRTKSCCAPSGRTPPPFHSRNTAQSNGRTGATGTSSLRASHSTSCPQCLCGTGWERFAAPRQGARRIRCRRRVCAQRRRGALPLRRALGRWAPFVDCLGDSPSLFWGRAGRVEEWLLTSELTYNVTKALMFYIYYF